MLCDDAVSCIYCGSAGLEHTSHGFADLYDIVLNIPRSSWQMCRKCSKPKELSIYGRYNNVCIAVFECTQRK